MPKSFEIFISYRRKGGYDTAKLLYDRLRIDGYSVSFDIDTLEKGNFDNELEQRVNNCKDFLLVLSPGAFDRFFDKSEDYNPEDDWVRREISCAIKTNKNIVPLALEGFEFPKNLPDDVKDIARKNAIDLNPKHFEDTYARMKRVFLLSKPNWATRHKKIIISSAAALFLALTASLFAISSNESKKDLEQKMQHLTDSIEAAKAMEIARATDSIKQAMASGARKAQPKAAAKEAKKEAPAAQKNSEKTLQKTLHWGGPNNDVGQAIFDKIASAGVSKAKCEGNGFVLKANNPNCEAANPEGQVACSYSPKLTIMDCGGKILSFLGTSVDFKTEPQKDEASAKKELAKELGSVDFSSWVLDIKEL